MCKYIKFAVCAALLVSLWGCSMPWENQQPVTEPAPAETLQATEAPAETTQPTEPEELAPYAVQTPVGTILFPAEFEDCLDVRMSREDALIITFYAVMEDKEQPLFDLWFSYTFKDGAAGMVQGDNQNYYVGFSLHPFEPDDTWTKGQTDTVYAMQEAANELLNQLELVAVDAAEEDIVIQTAWGELRYPGKWEPYLLVEQKTEDAAEFYAKLPGKEPLLLFTVCFGADETMAVITDQAGVETGVGIRFQELTPDSSWNQEELNVVYAMQEDLNFLLNALEQ